MKGRRKCIYLPGKQAAWLKDIAEVNGRSESYIVQLAIEKLVEMTGGYQEDWRLQDDNE